MTESKTSKNVNWESGHTKYSDTVTSSISKSSVFTVQTRNAFSKNSTLESAFEKLRFQCVRKANPQRKSHTETKTDSAWSQSCKKACACFWLVAYLKICARRWKNWGVYSRVPSSLAPSPPLFLPRSRSWPLPRLCLLRTLLSTEPKLTAPSEEILLIGVNLETQFKDEVLGKG